MELSLIAGVISRNSSYSEFSSTDEAYLQQKMMLRNFFPFAVVLSIHIEAMVSRLRASLELALGDALKHLYQQTFHMYREDRQLRSTVEEVQPPQDPP